MYIRNWRGKLVFLDVSKLNSEKEYYSKLWKIIYNKDINVDVDQKDSIIKYINGEIDFI